MSHIMAYLRYALGGCVGRTVALRSETNGVVDMLAAFLRRNILCHFVLFCKVLSLSDF